MYAYRLLSWFALFIFAATPTFAATLATCSTTELGRQRFSSTQIEICNGTKWTKTSVDPNAVLRPLGSCSTSQVGQQRFDSSALQMQYCNGTKWIKIGCATDDTDSTCTSTLIGKVKQDTTYHTLKFCNGTKWVYMSSIPGKPCCPDGYIPIPADPNAGTTQDFCVAKYHMKPLRMVDLTNVNGKDFGPQSLTDYKPESRASEQPWTGVDYVTAESICASLGANSHLITNAEWMTIAYSIESNINNWSGGAIGSGHIPTGHSDGHVDCDPLVPSNCWGQAGQDYLAASTNDNAGCFGTNNPNCLNKSDNDYWQKRTFQLSNGQIIWDFAGNVNTWVDAGGLHSSGMDTPAPRNIYQVNDSGPAGFPGPIQVYPTMTPNLFPPNPVAANNKRAFLPKYDANLSPSPAFNYGTAWYDQLGFGVIRLDTVNNWALFRGGEFQQTRIAHSGATDPDTWYRHFALTPENNPERRGGIYSAWLYPATSHWDNLGFRCVYDPN